MRWMVLQDFRMEFIRWITVFILISMITTSRSQEIIVNGRTFLKPLNAQVSYNEAIQACRDLGGRLSVILDEAMASSLSEQLTNVVWIGLNDIHTEGVFRWLDGQPLEYGKWDAGQPRGNSEMNCVAYHPGVLLGSFVTHFCDQPFAPLCDPDTGSGFEVCTDGDRCIHEPDYVWEKFSDLNLVKSSAVGLKIIWSGTLLVEGINACLAACTQEVTFNCVMSQWLDNVCYISANEETATFTLPVRNTYLRKKLSLLQSTTTQCYTLTPPNKFTIELANSVCEGVGGSALSITTVKDLQDIHNFLYSTAGRSESEGFWIGLQTDPLVRSLKNPDGSIPNELKWKEGETENPDGSVMCVIMSYGYLRVEPCNNTHEYLCQTDGCPGAFALANGTGTVITMNDTQHVRFTCDDGYAEPETRLYEKDEPLPAECVCSEPGTWPTPTITCLPFEELGLTCWSSDLDLSQYGREEVVGNDPAQPSDSYALDTKVLHTCKPGYISMNESASEIQTSRCAWGESEWEKTIYTYWTDYFPRCRANCSAQPWPVLSNSADYVEGTLEGQYIYFVCDPGYKFDTNVEIEKSSCMQNGSWSTVPHCKIQCGLPYLPFDTIAEYNGTMTGDTANIYCPDGFIWSNGDNATLMDCNDGCWELRVENNTCEVDCGVPPSINSIELSYNSTHAGSLAFYTCPTNFVFIDLADAHESVCQENGNWTVMNVTCIANCGAAPDVPTLSLKSNKSSLEGDTAVFECAPGFALRTGEDPSSLVSVCQKDGNWTTIKLKCVVDCGIPENLTHSNVSYAGTVDGDTATFTCLSGYAYDDGSEENNATCEPSGNWSTIPAQCLRSCGDPPTMNNGSFTIHNLTIEGHTASYKCDDGFLFVENDVHVVEITCDASGQWSEISTQCIANCSTPPDMPNANVSFTSTVENDTAEYTCNEQHNTADGDNSSTSVCLSNGNWSDAALCLANCGAPENVTHAQVDYDVTVAGEMAVYTCDPKFEPDDPEIEMMIKCTVNATWSSLDTECVANCGTPPEVALTSAEYKSTRGNSTATFTCDDTYVTMGRNEPSFQMRCNPDTAQWEGEDTCLPSCGEHPVYDSATTESQVTTVGTVANYMCDPGYGFLDHEPQHSIECPETQEWTTLDSKCIVDCGLPQSIDNGTVTYNDTFVEFEAVYICYEGFTRANKLPQETSTCENDGKWSLQPTHCFLDCGPPPEMTGSSDMTHDGTIVNSKAQYPCVVPPERLNGILIEITCQENGKWSAFPHVCLSDCGAPPDFDNSIEVYGTTYVGSTAQFITRRGYSWNQTVTISAMCEEPGVWDGVPVEDAQVSMLLPCLDPPKVARSTQQIQWDSVSYQLHVVATFAEDERRYPAGLAVHYQCHTGTLFPRNTTSRTTVCQVFGEWSDIDDCKVAMCPPLSSLPGIRNAHKYTKPKPFGTSVTLECEDGLLFSSGINQWQTECGLSKTFQPQWAPQPSGCAGPRCHPLPIVLNATVSTYSSDIRTRVEVSCYSGYRFDDMEAVKTPLCKPDLTWEDIGHCRPVMCEDLSPIAHGSLSAIFAYVLGSVEARCDDGYWFEPYVFNDTMHCSNEAVWGHIVDNCTELTCGDLYSVLNSTHTPPENNKFNSKTTFTCDPGLRLNDGMEEAVVECMANAYWRDHDFYTDCAAGRCPPLPIITNATVDGREASEGSNATYTCEPGHKFPEDGTHSYAVTCHEGSWDVNRTHCELVYCPKLPDISHALASTRDHHYPTKVNVTCDLGYYVEKFTDPRAFIVMHMLREENPGLEVPELWTTAVTLRCDDDGEWQSEDGRVTVTADELEGLCHPVKCTAHPIVEKAYYNVQENPVLGDQVTYTCKRDYWLQRDVYARTVECSADSSWQPTLNQNCTEIRCPVIPVWNNVIPSSFDVHVRSIVDVTCLNGTEMSGGGATKKTTTAAPGLAFALNGGIDVNGVDLVTVECMQSGKWEPELPTCNAPSNKTVIPPTEAPQAPAMGAIGAVMLAIVIVPAMIMDIPNLLEAIVRYRQILTCK